jgi:hypothetical protein
LWISFNYSTLVFSSSLPEGEWSRDRISWDQNWHFSWDQKFL